MNSKPILGKTRVPFTRLQIDLSIDQPPRLEAKEYYGHESRATRLVGDSRRFLTLAFTKTSKDSQIRKWLQDVVQRGEEIVIDGERYVYVFLGFTESNLKAGHLLFFREGDDFTVETLKENFGNLKPIYEDDGYGKYAARLGLSFSSTTPTEVVCSFLPDLTAADGSLTSDGCGLIRASYCPKVSSFLGVPADTAVFQIRLGGIKGVLTRCPDALFDEICDASDKKIAYRRSMLKYAGGPRMLEVQNVSRPPKSGRLNKQFIILLLTRGIPFTVFEEFLQMQLDEIDKVTTDRERALECVDGEVDAEGGPFFQDLYEMLLAGHDMNEPYLSTLLRRFQNVSREALRNKLHIPVKASGYMFGVVDHCGVLQDGEVFINLPAKGGPQVGSVAVMRNPAYDPDDVRVLEAVNKPELKHLTNCIVFSASGTHSETDKMGGGDLDGDQYYVIFNPLLIPRPRPSTTAPRVTQTPIRTITIAGQTQVIAPSMRRNVDIRASAIETFMEMRCNFLVGQISKKWTEVVGTTDELADRPECKALVPLLEDALDAIKKGGRLNRIKDDFRRAQKKIEQMQLSNDWENPLDLLAARIPTYIPEETEFVCDPHLILRSETSEEEWQRLACEAKVVMDDYNKDLTTAIKADKENS
ncbi:RNA-dependent RNA polymerase [Mycena capillaripes]|nr:RNA-dependent RNA polymerase [Mycena capillaripes]